MIAYKIIVISFFILMGLKTLSLGLDEKQEKAILAVQLFLFVGMILGVAMS